MASQPNGGVSYVCMAHPTRLGGVSRVLGQLGRECEIVVDHTEAGPWATAKRAWQLTPADSSWRCLLQDDIDLAPQFAEQLELLTSNPWLCGRPLALYNGLTTKSLPGKHWIERQDGVQGPVIVLPADAVWEMLAWVSDNVQETDAMRSADIRPSLWLESLGIPSLCPWPSWVQHRGWEPSLIGTHSTKGAPRTSPSYTGEPLGDIDWTEGLLGGEARIDGLPHGASARVRNKLWRVGATETDWVREKQQGQRA